MTREEAIEVYNGLINTKIKEAFEFFAPELRESEDERHRKWILEYLYDGLRKADEQFKGQFNAAIAYLEKQKEPIDPFDTKLFQDGVKEGRRLEREDIKKEQKPIEWKPLPESMEALLLAIEGEWDAIKPTGYMSRRLEDLYDGLVNTFDIDEKYLGNLPKTEYTEKDIEEIKALKKKIDSSMETKPAEWSEKDENNLELVIDCIYKFYPDPVMKYKLKEWLKSLRPVKQEWSEEDEKNRRNLMSLLANMRGDRITEETYQKYYPWLKSLRSRPKPSDNWKPSEEQMQYLLAVINDPNNAGAESCHLILESLYNDLKEL